MLKTRFELGERNIQLEHQDIEDKMKKPTAVFLSAILLFIATVCTIR